MKHLSQKRNIRLMIWGVLFCTVILITPHVSAQTDLKPYIDSVEQVQKGMTMWEMLRTGGFIMIVLGLLSVAATAIIIYNFLTLNTKKLCPDAFAEELMSRMERKDNATVKSMCYKGDNLLARVVMAGIDKKYRGNKLAVEAIENKARAEIDSLWQNISYLGDIASIAPLIGLLGTVLGMIQAFNVIAFKTAVVKPILLAGGVSKAMVTTAGGLFVAIPVLAFYSYFRGKITHISQRIENYINDVIEVFQEQK